MRLLNCLIAVVMLFALAAIAQARGRGVSVNNVSGPGFSSQSIQAGGGLFGRRNISVNNVNAGFGGGAGFNSFNSFNGFNRGFRSFNSFNSFGVGGCGVGCGVGVNAFGLRSRGIVFDSFGRPILLP